MKRSISIVLSLTLRETTHTQYIQNISFVIDLSTT